MGAGASIEDTGDLKKFYEAKKEDLTAEQQTELEGLYTKHESKEFLCIGKCKQAYAKMGLEDADPAFADPLKRDKPAPVAKEEPKQEPQPPAPEGVTRFKLTELPEIVKAAVAAGKTPLILDPSEHNKVDTFYTYSGSARLFDAKAMGIQHSLSGKSVDDCLEGARKATVAAMKGGLTLVVACQQGVVDVKGKFNGENTFPLALFEGAGVAYRREKAFAFVDGEPFTKLYRDEDVASTGGLCVIGAEFQVVVTSHFPSADIDEYLFSSGAFPPKENFAIYEVDLSEG